MSEQPGNSPPDDILQDFIRELKRAWWGGALAGAIAGSIAASGLWLQIWKYAHG